MTIRIGASEFGGTFTTQAQALQKILAKTSLPRVEVVESRFGASIENSYRLDAGEIDFGFVSAPWVAAAAKGVAPFSRLIELATVAPMNVGPNFFVVRADSDLETIADLRGKRVVVGLKSSGMTPHAEAVFAAIGIGADDLERVHVGFAEGAELLAQGAVDAQYQCPVPNEIMTRLSERIAVRVLRFTPSERAAALAAIPYDRPTIMHKGVIRGVDEDLQQLGVVNLLVAHVRADPEIVCGVTQAIVDHAAELGRLLPLFAELPELIATMRAERFAAMEFDGVRLHPGAARAYAQT